MTPATIALGVAVSAGGLAAASALLLYGTSRGWIWLAAGLVVLGSAMGAGIVALYGIRQRLINR